MFVAFSILNFEQFAQKVPEFLVLLTSPEWNLFSDPNFMLKSKPLPRQSTSLGQVISQNLHFRICGGYLTDLLLFH